MANGKIKIVKKGAKPTEDAAPQEAQMEEQQALSEASTEGNEPPWDAAEKKSGSGKVQIKPKGAAPAKAEAVVVAQPNKQAIPAESTEQVEIKGLITPGVEAAKVTVAMGLTKNLGDFNSARFDVAITVPCDPDKVDAAYAAGAQWVDERLTELQD